MPSGWPTGSWGASGAPRPEPERPQLEAELEGLKGEHEALTVAMSRTLEDKLRYVERHRSKLVKEADKRTAELRERYEQLVDQASQARAELAETRQTALWAACYPDPSAAADPPDALVGGYVAALQKAGVSAPVASSRIFELLATDARWLAAAATEAQRAAMGFKQPAEATWTATPEGVAADRREKKAALARYRQLWSRDPV